MVYVFLANGFEETEAVTPIDMLRRCGCEVAVVAVSVDGLTVTGSHGISVKADVSEKDVDMSKAEMIILPGGMPGTKNLASSEFVTGCLTEAVRRGIFIGAICAAPSVLGNLGLLKGREAVCYPGFESALKGARISDKPAVRDGSIITARGAGAALEFSEELIKALFSEEESRKLAESIVWKK